MDCAVGTTDRLSSVSLLMGVESNFGAADARAVVTWPGAEVAATYRRTDVQDPYCGLLWRPRNVNNLAKKNQSVQQVYCTCPLQSHGSAIATNSPSLLHIPTATFTSSVSVIDRSAAWRKSTWDDSSSSSNFSRARLSNSFGRCRPTYSTRCTHNNATDNYYWQ